MANASWRYRLLAVWSTRAFRRGALAAGAAAALSIAGAVGASRARMEAARVQLSQAVERLDEITAVALADRQSRAAVAWGYAERLRLGLESPFRLVEAASRDPRLLVDERRTVALALLSHITDGASHEIDPAALDGMGPTVKGRSVSGERHLELVERLMAEAEDPRAVELGIRMAYGLAAAERLVDGVAPILMAQAAALVADRELSRREAVGLLRSTRDDALGAVAQRRAARRFYVERPTMLEGGREREELAVRASKTAVAALRAMVHWDGVATGRPLDSVAAVLGPELLAVAAAAPPSGPLAVTVQRYRSALDASGRGVDREAFRRVHNAEMLVGALRPSGADRGNRRGVGRMLLAAAVASRSAAQQPAWFAGDSAPTAAALSAQLGLSEITFDRDVPAAWRPYFLAELARGLEDLRRVLPGLGFDALRVRFRMTAPADSALAMHDPRTRTLHLPVFTAAGTLTHELAHDLDRRSAQRQGHAGYRSDFVARSRAPSAAASRLAASLRALTEEQSDLPTGTAPRPERPAEIFATRVDWFVAQSLAGQGISNGFLSAVQDELLTGHVVHPERLRSAGRSRSLRTALEEMTVLPPLPTEIVSPSLQTLLRWALAAPVDSRRAAAIIRGERSAWQGSAGQCDDDDPRVGLLRQAADARARAWVHQRARWTDAGARPGWAQSALGRAPWAGDLAESRVAALRDQVLAGLATTEQLPVGISAYAAPLAERARCGA